MYHYEVGEVNAGNAVIKVYTLNQAWDEDITDWKKATSSTEWENSWGGGIPYGQQTITKSNYDPSTTKVWHDYSITDAVADWVDNPEENHGIILKIDDEKSEFICKSTESSDQTLLPKLTVNYDGTGTNEKCFTLSNEMLRVNQLQKTVHFGATDVHNYEISCYNAAGQMLLTTMIYKDCEIEIPFCFHSKGMHLLRIYNKKDQKQHIYKIVLID